MMGNFLTTLGNTPEEDRAMFEELGLNVARQPDNGANPRPDNRSGWLEGETPDVVEPRCSAPAAPSRRRSTCACGTPPPSCASRQASGARPAAPRRRAEHAAAARRTATRSGPSGTAAATVIEIEARLEELRALGLHRRTRLVSGPQGPRVLLDGKPVLLLCSNNYLGLADHPRVREAAAEAAMRWGVGAGASRLVSGTMTIHRRLEERLAAFKGRQSALLFGSGYLANTGVGRRAGPPRRRRLLRRAQPRLDHRRLPALARRDVFVYDHGDVEHLEWGIRRRRAAGGALIVTDSVFSMDGDVAPLAEIVELAPAPRRAGGRRRGPRHRARSGPAAAAPWPRRDWRTRST